MKLTNEIIIDVHKQSSELLSKHIITFTNNCINTIKQINGINPKALDISDFFIDILVMNGYYDTNCFEVNDVTIEDDNVYCNFKNGKVNINELSINDIQDITDTIVSNFEYLNKEECFVNN